MLGVEVKRKLIRHLRFEHIAKLAGVLCCELVLAKFRKNALDTSVYFFLQELKDEVDELLAFK